MDPRTAKRLTSRWPALLLLAALACEEPIDVRPPARTILRELRHASPHEKDPDYAGVGDLDADGCTEIYLGPLGEDRPTVFSGRDGRTLFEFDALWRYAGSADFDGDGHLDLLGVETGSIRVYSPRAGRELFALHATPSGAAIGPSILIAGDLNGDGGADLLITDVPPSPRMNKALYTHVWALAGRDGSLLWTVRGEYQRDYFGFDAVAAGDLDCDGHDDVFVSSGMRWRGYVLALSGRTGDTLMRVGTRVGKFLRTIPDVDGDGAVELVVAARGTTVFSGRWGHRLETAAPPQRVAYGDLDGDGSEDYLTNESGPGYRMYTYVRSAEGELLAKVRYSWYSFQYGRPAGDVDGDGVPDLLTPTSGGVFVLSGAKIRR